SPTFVIARLHEPVADGPALVHVDAYRLESLDEVDALDVDTSLDEAITVVEWGEGMVEQLSQDRLDIEIRRPRGEERDLDDDTRVITISGYGARRVGVVFPALLVGKDVPMFIRAYRTEDYAAIIDICRLTGDGGQDATPRLEHPELMGVVWAAPYLEYEPELALV